MGGCCCINKYCCRHPRRKQYIVICEKRLPARPFSDRNQAIRLKLIFMLLTEPCEGADMSVPVQGADKILSTMLAPMISTVSLLVLVNVIMI